MLENPIPIPYQNPEQISPEKERKDIQKPHLPRKCVCEMCTCGLHHCPKPRIKGIFETTYNHDYKQYKSTSSPYSIQPIPYKMRHYDKSILVTSYDDYNKTSELIQKRRSQQGSNNQKNKDQISIFENSAKAMLRHQSRFVGMSEYKDRFKEPPKRQKSLSVHYSMYNLPAVRFEGESSYKKDYIPHLPSTNKSLESIKVQLPQLQQKKSLPQPGSSQTLQNFVNLQTPKRIKTLPDVASYPCQSCPCSLIQIPTSNFTDHIHLRYDPEKKQWQ